MKPNADLSAATEHLISFAGQALTCRELGNRSDLPTQMFNPAPGKL